MGAEVTVPARPRKRPPGAGILHVMTDDTVSLVRAYYAAFNAADSAGMLDLLTDDVRHDVNEGETQTGVDAFRAFLAHMDEHYRERAEDVTVLVNGDGTRAAAEFMIHGTYVKTDGDLPGAAGQTYMLPVGAFFEVRGGKIARVTTHYNLADWTRQIRGQAQG